MEWQDLKRGDILRWSGPGDGFELYVVVNDPTTANSNDVIVPLLNLSTGTCFHDHHKPLYLKVRFPWSLEHG